MNPIWCRQNVIILFFCAFCGAPGQHKAYKAFQIPFLTDHPLSLCAYASMQDKAASWTVIISCTCRCGTTQCQSFLSPERTWLVPGPIQGNFPGSFMHFETWDLPVNLGSYHPTRSGRQWQRVQPSRDRGWRQDIRCWSLPWARENELPTSWCPQCTS